MSSADVEDQRFRGEKAAYGGDTLSRSPSGKVSPLPFVLPDELVSLNVSAPGSPDQRDSALPATTMLEASPDRVEPACVHFGTCGGCQYQMASYPAQLELKQSILREVLGTAGLSDLPAPQSWGSPEAYGYRNRIRLRVQLLAGEFQLGYSLRGTQDFLPIRMCPIAAPLLPNVMDMLPAAAEMSRELRQVFEMTSEVELFCDATETKLQVTFLTTGRGGFEPGRFLKAANALKTHCPALAGAGLSRVDPRSGRRMETLAAWGQAGLAYDVAGETYWITRGGFFQVNRFLLPRLVELVCGQRSGEIAWDLFAGVGLFSRVLAHRFLTVTAVEANASACADLRRALGKIGAQHRAVEATTLGFLQRALTERERPGLIVLDPPRAGAGEEVCALLARLRPAEIVYLSCDPTTLARDLVVLTRSGYAVAELHLIDLFPQTYHLETCVVLRLDMGD